jgi:hypothetical protein
MKNGRLSNLLNRSAKKTMYAGICIISENRKRVGLKMPDLTTKLDTTIKKISLAPNKNSPVTIVGKTVTIIKPLHTISDLEIILLCNRKKERSSG